MEERKTSVETMEGTWHMARFYITICFDAQYCDFIHKRASCIIRKGNEDGSQDVLCMLLSRVRYIVIKALRQVITSSFVLQGAVDNVVGGMWTFKDSL